MGSSSPRSFLTTAPSLHLATPKSTPLRPCSSSSVSSIATLDPTDRKQTVRSSASGAPWTTTSSRVPPSKTSIHFANELFEYIIYYNNFRPHQALSGKTPKDFAETK